MLVKYLGKTQPWGLEHGEYYRVNGIERGLYKISVWDDEETLYEPGQFEVIEDNMREVVNEIQADKYRVLGFREELPSKRYNAYSIDGELYEPVPIYDIVNCIAVESTESFIGKTVEFLYLLDAKSIFQNNLTPRISGQMRPRAAEINEAICKTQKDLFRLRKTDFRKNMPGIASYYIVTLRKMYHTSLEQRVQSFYDCLCEQLIDGEVLDCSNQCFTIRGEDYTITYCLEAYRYQAHVRGFMKDGQLQLEWLHRMGFEGSLRWLRRSKIAVNYDEIDTKMHAPKMVIAYPNPTDRFHAIVQTIKAEYKEDRKHGT